MARPPVAIPDTHAIDWTALPTARDGNVPGPVWKTLSLDPETGAATMLIHLPPGWHDDELDYHPCVEESLKLAGWNQIADRRLDTGVYLHRPAGILHGPVFACPEAGTSILSRFSAEMRVLRYTGDEFAHEDSVSITDDLANSTRPWTERLDTRELPWQEAPAGGPWGGARYRWISRDSATGGGAVQVQLPAGFRGRGAPGAGIVEEFVVEGAMRAGGVDYARWGYRCRAAGDGGGEIESADGALLMCWWDVDELSVGAAG